MRNTLSGGSLLNTDFRPLHADAGLLESESRLALPQPEVFPVDDGQHLPLPDGVAFLRPQPLDEAADLGADPHLTVGFDLSGQVEPVLDAVPGDLDSVHRHDLFRFLLGFPGGPVFSASTEKGGCQEQNEQQRRLS